MPLVSDACLGQCVEFRIAVTNGAQDLASRLTQAVGAEIVSRLGVGEPHRLSGGPGRTNQRVIPVVDSFVVHDLRVLEYIAQFVHRGGRHLELVKTIQNLIGRPLDERIVQHGANGFEVLGLTSLRNRVEPLVFPPFGMTERGA